MRMTQVALGDFLAGLINEILTAICHLQIIDIIRKCMQYIHISQCKCILHD